WTADYPYDPEDRTLGDRVGSLLGSEAGGVTPASAHLPDLRAYVAASTPWRLARLPRIRRRRNGRYTSNASSPRSGIGSESSSVQVNLVEPSTGSSDQIPVPRTKLRCAINIRRGGSHPTTSSCSANRGTCSTRFLTSMR